MNFFIPLIAGCAGAALGSFAAATAWCWLHEEPVPLLRSKCDNCGKTLRSRHLIPVFSYLALYGKCAFCGSQIPSFHFWVELACALVCALIAATVGLSPLAPVLMLLSIALITASAVDLEARLLPDFLTLGCMIFMPALVYLEPNLTLKDALIGIIAGGAIPLFLYFIFKIARHKECLGLGDVKLFALGGGLTGWQNLPLLFFFSATSAIILFLLIHFFSHKAASSLWENELPFGPFIAGAIMVILIFPSLSFHFYGLFC